MTKILLQGFTHEFLSSLFSYDEHTGLLIRKVTRSHNAKAGEVVGTVDGKGYLHVSVNKTFIRLHRLAWFLMMRELPQEIDHINRNSLGNTWSNLRACSTTQNHGNIRSSKNTSGYKGVSLHTNGRWQAQIKIEGQTTPLGLFDDPKEAASAYARAAEKHFGEEFALHDGGALA